jgi:hypothetical protein
MPARGGGFRLNCLTSALAEICRDHLLEEKWLIASSLRTAHQWLDAVTKSGQPLVNVQCTTVKGFALDLAAPHMARSGLRLISTRCATIIVDRILNSLKHESPGYLTSLQITHCLSQSVCSSISALRLAGIDPENLCPEGFELSDKSVELVRILKAYLSELETLGLVDYAGAIDIAVKVLGETRTPFGGDALILAPEDLDLTAKEKSALKSRQRLVEVPFQKLLPGIEEDGGSVPTVLRGVIDLAFLEPEGWVVVDYKTDRRPVDQLQELVERYRDQVLLYASAWSEMTEQDVHEAGIYFTHSGTYFACQPS